MVLPHDFIYPSEDDFSSLLGAKLIYDPDWATCTYVFYDQEGVAIVLTFSIAAPYVTIVISEDGRYLAEVGNEYPKTMAIKVEDGEKSIYIRCKMDERWQTIKCVVFPKWSLTVMAIDTHDEPDL